MARGAHERRARQRVLSLAQRRIDGDAGVKMTAAQLAETHRVRHVMGALTAALLRLDGMLAKFDTVLRP